MSINVVRSLCIITILKIKQEFSNISELRIVKKPLLYIILNDSKILNFKVI